MPNEAARQVVRRLIGQPARRLARAAVPGEPAAWIQRNERRAAARYNRDRPGNSRLRRSNDPHAGNSSGYDN